MDATFEAKLIECLDALESGESLEQVLIRYPQDRAKLQPILETAVALPALQMEPRQTSQAAARDNFLAQADALRDATTPRRRWFFARPLTAFVSLALVLLIGASGVVIMSGSALPGNLLYSLKRTVEEVRLSMSTDSATLATEFEQERIDETAALLATGREAEVEFSGSIESIQPDVWVVAGLDVYTGRTTRIDGAPQVGRRARVRGRTVDGLLRAIWIGVEPDNKPTTTPTPFPQYTPSSMTATHTPSPTNTPSPTPSSTLGASPSPTLSPIQSATQAPQDPPPTTTSPEASPTAMPSPTSLSPSATTTQQPTPTLTATDDSNDNENDNDDDNGNDNDNDNGNDNDNDNDDDNDNGNR